MSSSKKSSAKGKVGQKDSPKESNGKVAGSSVQKSVRQKLPEWSRGLKVVASVLILYHVCAMVFSPLSLPPTSGLIRFGQGFFSHYQSVLYLNHGYRFFAPNPGPSRLVVYEIEMTDGKIVKGIFPDRDAINKEYPRLLYHRWFMLSESIANLVRMDLTESRSKQIVDQLKQDLQQAEISGDKERVQRIERELERFQNLWKQEQQRRRKLLDPVAQAFLKQHPKAESVHLAIQVRHLPTIDQVREGISPGDKRFLRPEDRFDMGRWFANGEFRSMNSAGEDLEELPGAMELPKGVKE